MSIKNFLHKQVYLPIIHYYDLLQTSTGITAAFQYQDRISQDPWHNGAPAVLEES